MRGPDTAVAGLAAEPAAVAARDPDAAPPGSPGDLPILLDVAGRLDEGDVELGTYTDEELLAVTLEVPDAERLVALPAIADLGEAERTTAVRTALRSLAARGLVAPPAGIERPPPDGTADVEVYGELGMLLDVLARPRTVTLTDRELRGDARQRVWYGVDGGALLDHEPCPGGLHRFTLRRPARAAAQLAAFLDPHGWADRDGAPLLHHLDGPPPPGWDAVDRATEGAALTARVFSTGGAVPRQEREALVAGSPRGLWLLAVAQVDGRSAVRAVTVSPATLDAVAAALLGSGGRR